MYYVLETATEGLNINKKQIARVVAVLPSKKQADLVAADRNLVKDIKSVLVFSVETATNAAKKYDLRA